MNDQRSTKRVSDSVAGPTSPVVSTSISSPRVSATPRRTSTGSNASPSSERASASLSSSHGEVRLDPSAVVVATVSKNSRTKGRSSGAETRAQRASTRAPASSASAASSTSRARCDGLHVVDHGPHQALARAEVVQQHAVAGADRPGDVAQAAVAQAAGRDLGHDAGEQVGAGVGHLPTVALARQ